ncbi:hypothetical protein HOY82DRAFT_619257 [Tuber indicum]|nr:hypothetical protein HOY82DRAFT_619257 [Tuber indicum]
MSTQLEEYRGEVEMVRKELGGEREKMEKWVKERREFVPLSPERTPELEEKKVDGGGVKRGVRVEEGEGKRRCVGEEFGGNGFDPESWWGNWNLVAVRVNGVVWEDGIDEKDRKARKLRGAWLSTVLAMVRGAKAGQELCRSGLWVKGRWCSVKRFVAVPPKKE